MNKKAPIQLEAKDLRKNYYGKTVLENVSFELRRGQVVGLIGPNGAGKTTSFYITMGLIQPDSGQVIFEGRDISNLPPHKRAKLGIGYLSQEPSVFRELSVEDNIIALLETMNLSKKEQQIELTTLLQELHLSALAKKKACTLSGGERRRLEITRALALKPSVLLLDEPFANVDPLTIQDLRALIHHLCQKGISILITDHNARELFKIADHCYLISNGQVLATGSGDELMKNPIVRERYLGSEFTL